MADRNSNVARVERSFDHNRDTRSLFLRPDRSFGFTPGQFISALIPVGDEVLRRAYSIASMSDGLEICFNRIANGRGVEWLFNRAAGDEIEFMGPFGTFMLDRPPQLETIFLAEETAIAPIRPMLQFAQTSAHAPMHLLYASRDDAHILYRAELHELAARDSAFRFEPLIDDNPLARLAGEAQRRWIDGDTNRARQFYICGVGREVTRIRDLLRASGYERRAVRYEQW